MEAIFCVIASIVVKRFFRSSEKASFKYVGVPPTNRVIYSTNYEMFGIKLNSFGKTLTREDVDLAKVDPSEYYIYSYKGKLNDLKEAVIVLSLLKKFFF